MKVILILFLMAYAVNIAMGCKCPPCDERWKVVPYRYIVSERDLHHVKDDVYITIDSFQTLSPLEGFGRVPQYHAPLTRVEKEVYATYMIVSSHYNLSAIGYINACPVMRYSLKWSKESWYVPDQLIGRCHQGKEGECVESLRQLGIHLYHRELSTFTIQIPNHFNFRHSISDVMKHLENFEGVWDYVDYIPILN
jgi:hypothetical protein